MPGNRGRFAVGLTALVAGLAALTVAAPAWAGSWQFERLDGMGGADGRTTAGTGFYNSAVLYDNEPQVFYAAQTPGGGDALRHAWWNGSAWRFETLDGQGSGYAGYTSDPVGYGVSAVAYTPSGAGAQLHVFYCDDDAGVGAPGVLRHAWWDGTAWHFETLDGTGSSYPGSTTGGVCEPESVSALVVAGALQVFYADPTAHTLRQALLTGGSWSFATVDGAGGVATGATSDTVGQYVASTVFDNQVHVFYWDANTGLLRHAWYATGWTAQSLTLAPAGAAGTGDGASRGISALVWSNQLHVFYHDSANGTLGHVWYASGSWSAQVLDGPGGICKGAATTDDSGNYPAAVVYQNEPHVWYEGDTTPAGSARLRQAWWTGSAWDCQTLDGPGSSGATSHLVGGYNTVLAYGTQVHDWYTDYTTLTLAHAWYG